ncbi:DUF2846 domain-containing protein [Niveibacterium sp. 24ML]|uniref:DUF2846 domain-containing protein n=1 Tax=Niveibacterium sp. 24ML TaxID=2985512 RepID=UPI00226FBDA5|nr:DUF2846 domain-containing protein [Niveibacterium sp. 24ML]MCX9158052.1 DUF2846 domain-containing protein [Niveibacterium sp. 24ML]
MILRLVFLLFASCTLAACATGAAFTAVEPAPAEHAQVVFYRKFNIVGAVRTHELRSDGKVLGAAINGGFFSAMLPPGRRTVFGEGCAPAPLNVNVEAGRTYFVEAMVGGTYLGDGTTLHTWQFACGLALRDSNVALEALKSLRLSGS